MAAEFCPRRCALIAKPHPCLFRMKDDKLHSIILILSHSPRSSITETADLAGRASHYNPRPASGAREKNLRCCCASLADGLPDPLAGGGHVELVDAERLQRVHDRD